MLFSLGLKVVKISLRKLWVRKAFFSNAGKFFHYKNFYKFRLIWISNVDLFEMMR